MNRRRLLTAVGVVVFIVAPMLGSSAHAATRRHRPTITHVEAEVTILRRQVRSLIERTRYLERQQAYDERVMGCVGWLPVQLGAYDAPAQSPAPWPYALTTDPNVTTANLWFAYATGTCLDQLDTLTP